MLISAAVLRAWISALSALLAAVLLTGCPSPTPNQPAGNGDNSSNSSSAARANTKDDPQAVAGLEEAGAALKKGADGNVIEVTLSRGNNDDLKFVAALPNVTVLTAEVPGINGEGLAHLKAHPALKTLRLAQSDIKNEDARYLLDIPKLDDLDLTKTDLTLPAYETIGTSKSIRKIRAPQTRFDNDCLQAVCGMKQLVALDLTDCDAITAAGCESLASLTNLEMLRLHGPSINDEALKSISKLSKLKVLRILQGGVTKEGVALLQGHKNLKELNLYGNRGLENDALEALGSIANLEILGLRGTLVDNNGMRFLAGLTKLKELDLSESKIGNGENFAALANVQTLQDLNVWQTDIGDADMPAVGKLKGLKRLNLDKTLVTDKGLENVQELASLEYIHLGKTMITDAGLAHLHGLTKLKTVIVTFVPGVSAEGAAELQKAVPGVDVKR